MLADFEPKRLAGTEWTASREERIEHAIPPSSFLQDILHTLLVGARLLLMLYQRRVNEFLVPRPRE